MPSPDYEKYAGDVRDATFAKVRRMAQDSGDRDFSTKPMTPERSALAYSRNTFGGGGVVSYNTKPEYRSPGDVTPEKLAADKAAASPSSFKRGGHVKKSGLARVHKGEKVLTRKQVRGKGMR